MMEVIQENKTENNAFISMSLKLISRNVLIVFIVVDLILVGTLAAAAIGKLFTAGEYGDLPTEVLEDATGEEEFFLSNRLPEPLGFIAYHLDLNRENNFATLWETLQIIALSLLSFSIFLSIKKKEIVSRIGWLIISAAFLALAVEEFFSLHEWLGLKFQSHERIDFGPMVWEGASRWIVLYSIPIAVVLIIMLVSFFRLFKQRVRSRNFALLALFLWVLTLVMESIVSGYSLKFYRLVVFFEESFELGGILAMMFAFILYLRSYIENNAVAKKPD